MLWKGRYRGMLLPMMRNSSGDPAGSFSCVLINLGEEQKRVVDSLKPVQQVKALLR